MVQYENPSHFIEDVDRFKYLPAKKLQHTGPDSGQPSFPQVTPRLASPAARVVCNVHGYCSSNSCCTGSLGEAPLLFDAETKS